MNALRVHRLSGLACAALIAAAPCACRKDETARPDSAAAQSAGARAVADAALEEDDEGADEPNEAPPAPMGAWVHGETSSLRVRAFDASPTVKAPAAPAGKRHVAVDFELENRGLMPLALKPTRLRLRDQRGNEFAPAAAFAGDDATQEVFLLGLPPGQTAPLRLHYTVTTESPIIRLILNDGASLLPATIDEAAAMVAARKAAKPRKKRKTR